MRCRVCHDVGMTATAVLRPPHDDVVARRYASWLARVLAVAMDSGLLGLCVWLVAPGAGVPAVWPGLPPWQGATDAVPVELGGAASWTVAVVLLVQFGLQAWTGATIGKRAVGMVVVDDATGRPVGALRTVWRQLLHLLDAVLLIGYLRPVWHPQRRTFADSLARTVVVDASWPPAWAAVAPRPTRVAQSVAAALGVVGLLALFVQSGGASTVTVAQAPCVLEDGAPRGLHARVEVERSASWEMRLWIRQELPAAPGTVRVVWSALPGAPGHGEVEVTADVTALDGADEGRVWHAAAAGTLAAGEQTVVDVERAAGGAGGLDVRSRVDADAGGFACSARVTLTAADLAGTSR